MGVVSTLVLTDIVDSTQLNSIIDDEAMAGVWAAHDTMTRALIRSKLGREVGRSDGFLVLFDGADDALDFARAYHRRLLGMPHPLRARVGIHTGSVMLRENSSEDREQGATPFEIDGIALPVAARLMAAAGAGQTLVSTAVLAAATDTGLRQLSHGHWLFKGLEEPMEVFEVGDEDAPFRVPPDSAKAYRVVMQNGHWLPARQIARHLPAERDGFVGRRDALRSLRTSLHGGERLVSVLGAGGTGKSRLVTRYAWENLGDYPGGAWFCDLSQARTLEGVAFEVAQGLQMPLGKADLVTQLAQAISGRGECLVILDNFEQVARHAEATVGEWIERAPLARFVVTTREVLGIPGEHVLPLAPLTGSEAEELFMLRAAAARDVYVPGDPDRQAIRELVRVLDGLPLAIELAAARVRVISPRMLLSRVRDRLDLVVARSGRNDRQSTLRATFDWSWDLLSDRERAGLAALSVFEGGFTIESAAAIWDSVPAAWPEVVDCLQGLVDKSLVRQVGDSRFDLLETVRDYAAQRLGGPGNFPGSGPEAAAQTSCRYWRFFAALDERSAVADRCVEANNLVGACRAACAGGDAPAAAACLAVAWSALRLTGPYRIAVELADKVARMPSLQDRERALVHWVAGDALELNGDIESARQHLQRGLACAERVGAGEVIVRLLVAQGNRQTLDGELELAQSTLEQAHRQACALASVGLQMMASNALGVLFDRQSRWPEARKAYESALALARSLGDRHMEGGLLGNLGGLLLDMGHLQEAQARYEQSLDVTREVGDRRWEGNARCNLGLLHQKQGRFSQAHGQFELALETARHLGHIRLEYTVLCNIGILLSHEGRLEEAGRQIELAVRAAADCSDRRAEGQFRGHLAVNLAHRGQLESARESLAIGERRLLAMADRLSYALLLCDRAEVEALGGGLETARQALEQAVRIAQALACDSDSELCQRIAALGLRLGQGA